MYCAICKHIPCLSISDRLLLGHQIKMWVAAVVILPE